MMHIKKILFVLMIHIKKILFVLMMLFIGGVVNSFHDGSEYLIHIAFLYAFVFYTLPTIKGDK